MRTFALASLVLLTISGPAMAIDFITNDNGQIEFVMPSGNIGCIYTPEGGTGTYQPEDGGPELSCDRVKPSYSRVILGEDGPARRYSDVGDASCCGADNVFDYGESWSEGPFTCLSSTSGLKCTTGEHGFSMSRKAIKVY